MSSELKNLFDVVLSIITMFGAAVAFWIGLHQWRRGQAWQRAKKLDELIEKFENDQLLRVAATILDWSDRDITFGNDILRVRNDEALLALRDHRTIESHPMFPGKQATLRDAYDALLGFMERLEFAISTRLIDTAPAKDYFAYWLRRLITFDRHKIDEGSPLKGKTPQEMVAGYIRTYGDIDCIRRLCSAFGVKNSL